MAYTDERDSELPGCVEEAPKEGSMKSMKLKKMAARSQSRDAITDEELNEIEREASNWTSNRTHVDRSRLAIHTILRLVRELRAARLRPRTLGTMTTLATRQREIGNKEDFDIAILDANGAPVPLNTNGFRKFDYDCKAKGDMTVTEWKRFRFSPTYGGYDCIVLNGDGTEAHGNVKLSSVRATYEAE
jgi:hypothetical protein